MILKTHRLKETEKTYEKLMRALYHLEDLTNYKSGSLSEIINKLQSAEIKYEELK